MDGNKQYPWKFIGVSAGFHIIAGALVFQSLSKPVQPIRTVSTIEVSLVSAVETRPVPTKLRQPMRTSSKKSGDLPVHKASSMKEPEAPTVDEAPARLEEVREEMVHQPSSPGSEALSVSEGFGEPATGNSSHPEELSRFLQDVRNRLEQAKGYPWRARLQGQEGTVRIQFMIGSSGEPKNIHLMESSGSKTLDDEAIATVGRVGRFSEPPASWNEGVPIQVPLVFQLNSP